MTVTVEPAVTTGPIAGSCKAYREVAAPGGGPSLKVPFAGEPVQRRSLRPLRHLRPYTDSDAVIDLMAGLPARPAWSATAAHSCSVPAPVRSPPRWRSSPPRGHARRTGARRGRPRPRGHPGQSQPPRERADDHRKAFLVKVNANIGNSAVSSSIAERSTDGVGHPLGCRQHHGLVHRQEHPRNPRVDPA